MENDIAVWFENVSKVYRLGKRRKDTLKETILSSYRRSKGERFFALDNVSFAVQRGEILGFIGDNGSGKSTILKIVSGITVPTSGRMKTQGRISALLEVGAGFHPEMTGRENIFLSGAVLGIGERELKSRFDAIVSFAELEEFIDTPVKFYSSGMYTRLGFAIATNVDPDILLVDEVLSVGDNFFQQKCRNHMEEIRKSGKTVLFVSHDLLTIQLICSRLIFLDHGRIVTEGHPSDVVFEYQRHIQERQFATSKSQGTVSRGFYNRAGTQEASITAVRFLDGRGNERDQFDLCEPVTVALDFRNFELDRPVTIGLTIFDSDRTRLFDCCSRDDGLVLADLPEQGTITMTLPEVMLMPGVHFISVSILEADVDFFSPNLREQAIDVMSFQHSFMIRRRERAGRMGGMVYMKRRWKLVSGGRVLAEAGTD